MKLHLVMLLLAVDACSPAPAAERLRAVIAGIGERDAARPQQSTLRLDRASRADLLALRQAQSDLAGISRTATLDAALLGRTVSPKVKEALQTLDRASVSGLRPLFGEGSERATALLDVGWVARDEPPEDAASAFLHDQDDAVRIALGVPADLVLYAAGSRPQDDATLVAFRARCHGVEVEGASLFLSVTSPAHRLGAGVVDSVDASLPAEARCPLGAEDVLSAATAIDNALARYAVDPSKGRSFSTALSLVPPSDYLWRVSGPFAKGVASVDIDAVSGRFVRAQQRLHASGIVAGDFRPLTGRASPTDVRATYPLPHINIWKDEGGSVSLLASADADGAWSGAASSSATFTAQLTSSPLAANTYGASGTFRLFADAILCDETITANAYPLLGDGSVSLISDSDHARIFFLNTWVRQRFADYAHEVPYKNGLYVSATPLRGFANFCAGPPFWSATELGFNDDLTVLHEAAHTYQFCARVAGWGCDGPISGPTDYLTSVKGAILEGHADWVTVALTGYRSAYFNAWVSQRFFGNATTTLDWFVPWGELYSAPCAVDADCAAGQACPVAHDPDLGPAFCMKTITSGAECLALYGPSINVQVWSDPPLAPIATCGRNEDNYINGLVLGNAWTFLQLWLGPMPGFDAVSDGLDQGWNGSTDMAGPIGGNNIYSKTVMANWSTAYETFRAFYQAFPYAMSLPYIDDYPSQPQTAPVMETLGRTTTTVAWGTIDGDTTASIDRPGDLDFIHIKAVEGETVTITTKVTSGTLDSCLTLYGATRAWDDGGVLLRRDGACNSGTATGSNISYSVPIGSPFEWLVIKIEGLGTSFGDYTLTVTSDDYADHAVGAPTWQDAFPLAPVKFVAGNMDSATDSDWFKIFVPDLSATTIEITYFSDDYVPQTSIWTHALSGSGGPGPANCVGTGLTVTCPLDEQPAWYYILARSPGSTGNYQIRARLLTASGSPVATSAIDVSDAAGYGPSVSFGWGDMVAQRLYAGDQDNFELPALAEGDRVTVNVALDSTSCMVSAKLIDRAVTDVPAPLGYNAGYFIQGDGIAMEDNRGHGMDFGAGGKGAYFSFVAPHAGVYTISIGDFLGCSGEDYRAYFARVHDAASTHHVPGFTAVGP